MRAVWTVWGSAGRRVWGNLPRLIVTNLLWLVLAWPLLTLGAATLGTYAFLRRNVLEHDVRRSEELGTGVPVHDDPYARLLVDARRALLPGTLWGVTSVAFVALVTLGARFWAARAGGVPGDALVVLALYLGWLWLAAQPFVLDALAEGRSLRAAWSEAALIVASYPLYAHLCALPPLLLGVLAWLLETLWPLVGTSVLLVYWAHVATGDPNRKVSRVHEVL
ncbi:hypothetical protein [Deinococcus pimensis]|uniref:hypothetical protein n=1 Tax=Deinococcus pimensis TaxID=309888 RepID=UPI00048093A6|nr:hypothetical protein [Deinococcus pimensis]